MNEQAEVATFFHELVHAIKFTMGETGHDEKEVEGFGNLLCQWYKTRQAV
jgi:Zn-dependent oligopeptidase